MNNRIVFLDYLRVVACFMVLLVHCCEQYYFNDKGEFAIASAWDAGWLVWIDSACRAAVPLFVMASAYLLFPVTRPTGDFFRRRLLRVAVPFAVWACVYNWYNDGSWGQMLFNFPMATGGHLWFVPMLLGLYLLMPLLSPWAERASAREVRGWLVVWLFTTTFPFLRKLWACLFAPGVDPATGFYWAHTFGTGNFDCMPFLWGECPWNGFGTFHYLSGFIGYLLAGAYARKFMLEEGRSYVALGAGLTLVGYALTLGGFLWMLFYHLPTAENYWDFYPDFELPWQFCNVPVCMLTIGLFLLIFRWQPRRKMPVLLSEFSRLSYGVYLAHIMFLTAFYERIFLHLDWPVPVEILSIGLLTVITTFLLIKALSYLPKSKYIVG